MSNEDEKRSSSESPVTCTLSNVELRIREATHLAEFIKGVVISTEELENGYAFHVRGDKESMALIGELIAAERDCCRFLTFELTAEKLLNASLDFPQLEPQGN